MVTGWLQRSGEHALVSVCTALDPTQSQPRRRRRASVGRAWCPDRQCPRYTQDPRTLRILCQERFLSVRKSQQQLAGGLACHQSANPRMRHPSHTAWNPKTTGLALSPHDVPSFRSSLVDPSQAQDFDWQLLKGWEGAQGRGFPRL